MRKLLLIPVFLFAMVPLFGCGRSTLNATTSENPSLNTFETGALSLEEKYLQSQSDEGLKELCDQLTILPWEDKQLRQMVLKYYPIFFEKFNPDESDGIGESGFDPYYAMYVFSYKAEGRGGFIPIYNEYKEKASDIYLYARTVYGWVLGLNNVTTEEYDFLYDEAYHLYSTARESVEVYTTADKNKEAFFKVLSAFGCINEICEAMGKEVDPAIMNDLKEYMESYQKIMDSFR